MQHTGSNITRAVVIGSDNFTAGRRRIRPDTKEYFVWLIYSVIFCFGCHNNCLSYSTHLPWQICHYIRFIIYTSGFSVSIRSHTTKCWKNRFKSKLHNVHSKFKFQDEINSFNKIKTLISEFVLSHMKTYWQQHKTINSN